MKFWQLLSIAGYDLVRAVAADRPDWATYAAWCIAPHDRAISDAQVTPAFWRAVLSRIERPLYLGPDGWLRSFPFGGHPPITMLAAADRFGGALVEEALEKGSARA